MQPRPRTYSAFQEFALRQGDFCLAGVAVTATFDVDGRVERCRIVAAGVAPTPLRLTAVEELVTGSSWTPPHLAAAQEAARLEVSPLGDARADAAYRRHLLSVLVAQGAECTARRTATTARDKKEQTDAP